MAIVLDGVSLPDDLVWVNEFNESVVAQNTQRSLTGGMIIQESVKIKGVSMILSGDENSGWIERSQLILLKAIVDTVDHDMVLTFHGDNYNIRFDRSSAAIVTQPIVDCTDPEDDAPYSIQINLITV